MDDDKKEKPKQKELSGAVYIGSGRFLSGIPTRDLNAEEWMSFSKSERKHFVELGLYEVKYD